MSAETKDLVKLVAVTDHDCGNYEMGEIDFRYNPEELRRHVERYGSAGLLRKLNYFIHVVFEIQDDLVRDEQANVKAWP